MPVPFPSRALALAGLLTAAAAAHGTDFNVSGEVMIGTCDWSMGDADRQVVLDPIEASMLPVARGSGYVSFELNLQDCTDAVRKAVFGFSGSPAPGAPPLLRNVGDATGVAVVLESEGGRIIAADGSDSERVVTVVGQRARLRLRAGYWRLGAPAAGVGSVAATAVVTLRYE